jgi:hypothetical protein
MEKRKNKQTKIRDTKSGETILKGRILSKMKCQTVFPEQQEPIIQIQQSSEDYVALFSPSFHSDIQAFGRLDSIP